MSNTMISTTTTSTASLTFTSNVRFKAGAKGRRRMVIGDDVKPPTVPPGRVPRVARLMGLAIRLDGLLASGEIHDFAELARIGHVSRARVSQIMNLLLLAPDLQEALLFLPLTTAGRDPITEEMLRPIAAEPRWWVQRKMWKRLDAGSTSHR